MGYITCDIGDISIILYTWSSQRSYPSGRLGESTPFQAEERQQGIGPRGRLRSR